MKLFIFPVLFPVAYFACFLFPESVAALIVYVFTFWMALFSLMYLNNWGFGALLRRDRKRRGGE